MCCNCTTKYSLHQILHSSFPEKQQLLVVIQVMGKLSQALFPYSENPVISKPKIFAQKTLSNFILTGKAKDLENMRR